MFKSGELPNDILTCSDRETDRKLPINSGTINSILFARLNWEIKKKLAEKKLSFAQKEQNIIDNNGQYLLHWIGFSLNKFLFRTPNSRGDFLYDLLETDSYFTRQISKICFCFSTCSIQLGTVRSGYICGGFGLWSSRFEKVQRPAGESQYRRIHKT